MEQVKIIKTSKPTLFQDDLNEAKELGYRIRSLETQPDYYCAVMELDTDPDLSEARNFVKVEPDTNTKNGTPLIEQLYSKGWRITSEYSKHVNMAYFPGLQGKMKNG